MGSVLSETKLKDLTSGKNSEVVVLREDATVEIALRVRARRAFKTAGNPVSMPGA